MCRIRTVDQVDRGRRREEKGGRKAKGKRSPPSDGQGVEATAARAVIDRRVNEGVKSRNLNRRNRSRETTDCLLNRNSALYPRQLFLPRSQTVTVTKVKDCASPRPGVGVDPEVVQGPDLGAVPGVKAGREVDPGPDPRAVPGVRAVREVEAVQGRAVTAADGPGAVRRGRKAVQGLDGHGVVLGAVVRVPDLGDDQALAQDPVVGLIESRTNIAKAG
uniref:Uncharacterized protein n=1 Tax=Cacopsylla melanoneura TaxID=428564 RepID=A0A8D9EMX0_9HEMI